MIWEELQQLSIFNAEVSRGIVHRDDWIRKMMRLQERFNLEQKEELERIANGK